MPFTPLHMGPGMAIKAVGGRYFSVLVFGIAQVVTDIEPLVGMLTGAQVLHGWTHSYVGATIIGLGVMLAAPALCRPILRRWNRELEHYGLRRLVSPEAIELPAAASGAFVGTYSHAFLDSIMHADMRPFSPWSSANGLLDYLPVDTLYAACVAAGVVGVSIWMAIRLWQRKRPAGERA